MNLEEITAVFGALAAIVAFGSMVAHVTLGKDMERFATLLSIMQWILGVLSVILGAIAVASLFKEPRDQATIILALFLLGFAGIIAMLVSALAIERFRERRSPEAADPDETSPASDVSQNESATPTASS